MIYLYYIQKPAATRGKNIAQIVLNLNNITFYKRLSRLMLK